MLSFPASASVRKGGSVFRCICRGRRQWRSTADLSKEKEKLSAPREILSGFPSVAAREVIPTEPTPPDTGLKKIMVPLPLAQKKSSRPGLSGRASHSHFPHE